ncbi:MAG: homoserine dehydrogenase [Promethearchaeota archaeon]
MKKINLVIVGYGGVGRSLVKILHQDRDYLQKTFGFSSQIKAICEFKGALVNDNGIDIDKLLALTDIAQSPDWVADKTALDVISEVKADILVECSWSSKTGEPAVSTLKAAMNQKMHVVSSNKAPFYLKYKEMKDVADKNGVLMQIESTVLSAVPALAAKNSLAGTHIKSIKGILNGTSNYILTRMTQAGLPFGEALKEAQDLGYAEADPTLDVGGGDAAGKIVILANVLLGWDKTLSDVEIHGIEKVTPADIEAAKQENKYVKHICGAKDGKLTVGTELVPMDSTLAVMGSLNLVEIETENAGPYTFIGRGAGGPEAASGILSDVINIALQKF